MDRDEVFHILRGRLRFEVGNESFVAQAGDTLTAPKGVTFLALMISCYISIAAHKRISAHEKRD